MRLVNFDEIHRGHERFLRDNENLMRDATERAAARALDHVQRYPLFTPRTGKLQKRTRARAFRIGSKGYKFLLTNTLDYAQTIDGGSRGHPIVAKNAPYLHFRGRNGKWVKKKEVFHPGTRPYKFAYRATMSAYRILGQSLEQRMHMAAQRF